MCPIIGITTMPRTVASSAGEIEAHVSPHTYSDGVLRAGGIPVLLPQVPHRDIPALVDRLDGLIFSGGGDIEAHRYGANTHETMRRMDFDRDEFELALAREAKERSLPVLAICRGLQIVNVALGGTLIQDIPTEVGSMDHTVIGHAVYDGHQPVTVDANSRIARTVEATDLMVNSIHHQAVKQLAPGFRAVAWAGDGVIEGIEHDDSGWPLLAVQWHPEYLGHNNDVASRALFDGLIETARVEAAV